ncbi:hypothetical protein GX441_05775 [bacterium]|nr:hypothetical protein [bacterium]
MFNCVLVLLFNAGGWTSVHEFESKLHPYKRTETRLITETRPGELTHVVYGFLPHWRGSGTWDLKLNLLTHLAWFGIELDSTGLIKEYNGWPEDWQWLKEHTQASGVRFDLAVTCFDWSGKKVHTLLADSAARATAIQTILADAEGCNGVNIDFERPSMDDRDGFAQFLEDLRDSLHQRGMTLSVDLTAVNWGERFDVARISKAVDYIFIMGYDFHYPGSPNAGPVAPLDAETYNIKKTVDYYIEQSGGLSERFILGVPYYGYDWSVADTEPYAATKAQGTAYIYSTCESRAEQYGRKWHEATSSPWFYYKSAETLRQCWFEDTLSLSLKFDLLKGKNLRGAGIWALTYDNGRDELWNLLARFFTTGIAEKPATDAEKILLLPGMVSRSDVRNFLTVNPEYKAYDVSGRMLENPQRGVIFLRSDTRSIKVVVTK